MGFDMNYQKKISHPVLLTIFVLFVTGCGTKAIKLEERDTSGKFDGNWQASVFIKKQQDIVNVQGETMRLMCSDIKYKLTLIVADGRIWSTQNEKSDGYVKEDGTFSMDVQYEYEGGGKRYFYYSGNLGNGKGLGNVVLSRGSPKRGCRGTVTLENSGKSFSDVTPMYSGELRALISGNTWMGVTSKKTKFDIYNSPDGSMFGRAVTKYDAEDVDSGTWKINADGTKLEGSWTNGARSGKWDLTRIQ